MPESQREMLVRKMVAEGTSDDDIRATLKVFDAQQASAPAPAPDVRSRPLLTGLTDAGAARQFSDPSAMQDLQAAKNRMANVGIAGGAMAMGGLAAATPLTTALSSGTVGGIGQAIGAGGAYYGLRQAGVPAPIVDALMIATGLRAGLRGALRQAQGAEPPPRMIRVGGTTVDRYLPNRGAASHAGDAEAVALPMESPVLRYLPNRSGPVQPGSTQAVGEPVSPLVDRYLANRGGPVQEGSTQAVGARVPQLLDRYMPNSGAASHAGDPNAVASVRLASPAIERYLPNSSTYQAGQSPAIALLQPTAQESAQAAAARAMPSGPTARQPRPDLAAPQPTDMPRSWHAFLNEDARSAASASERQRIQALHKELAQMDADYKSATAGERAQWQAMPSDYRDALLAALLGGK